MHCAPTWPSLRAQALPSTCMAAHTARTGAVSHQLWPCRRPAWPCRSACRAPVRPLAPRAYALHTSALPSACSSSHNTIRLYCNTISLKPALQPQSRYKICILTHCLPQPAFLLYCNTNSPLSQPPNYIAIQFPPRPATSYCNTNLVLQYNFFPSHTALSCNTLPFLAIQLGSSPNQFCNTLFFSFFTIFFFTHFWLLENVPNIIFIQFFFLQYTPNKFMKIYFLHFSLTLHTVKLLEKYFFSSYNFFFHISSHWKTLKKLYTYFFSHFPEYSNKFIKIYFIQFSSVLHCKTLKIKFFSSPLNQINL